MTDLKELLERVKAATRPDRGLDRAIWVALINKRDFSYRSPLVTASIDAALALTERVLPGWWWLREDGQSIRLVGPDNGDCYPSVVGKHHLVPLAILAATLQALIAKGEA